MTNRRKQLLIGVVLLLFFSAFPAYPQAPLRSVQGLAVYDDNGKRVGSVVGFGGGPRVGALPPVVVLTSNGLLFTLSVLRNRFVGTDGALFFQSTDCSGTPFFETAFEPATPHSFVRNHVAYTQTVSTPLRINANSAYYGLAVEGCFNISSSDMDGIPATPVIDLNAHFKPPFTLR